MLQIDLGTEKLDQTSFATNMHFALGYKKNVNLKRNIYKRKHSMNIDIKR
jgi:hypothetical protein